VIGRIILLAAATVAIAVSAGAQSWPGKPVVLVVPTPPGSSLDVVARTLGEPLQARWKLPVVIENKPGAGGMIGMDSIAKSAPDGHRLGVGFNGPIAYAPLLYGKMSYDPANDLVPIVLTTSQPNLLAVNASVPAGTLPEFVAWAKQQGGKVNYASIGIGSSSHLTMELLKSAAGFAAAHVPFNGSPAAGTSVATGETHALFAVETALLPYIQSRQLKVLAASSPVRTPGLERTPTIADSGYPGFEAVTWNGLFAAARTPAELIERINADVNAALREPRVRDVLVNLGLAPGGGSPAEFKALIERDGGTWKDIIAKANIKLD